MPGNCGAEARCFRNSTNWFWEGSYFSIAAAFTEKLVETRTRLCLSCDAFSFYNERPGLSLKAFAIGLGDEKGDKELVAGGFHVDLLYKKTETSSETQSVLCFSTC